MLPLGEQAVSKGGSEGPQVGEAAGEQQDVSDQSAGFGLEVRESFLPSNLTHIKTDSLN